MAPSSSEIAQIFAPLSQRGRGAEFFEHVSDNVHWTIIGHTSMSGVFTTKQSFMDSTLSVLGSKVLTEPLRVEVVQVTGGGASEWAAVELKSVEGTVCKNGLKYDMRYVWICRFQEATIVEVRAYLDTDLLSRAIEGNQ